MPAADKRQPLFAIRLSRKHGSQEEAARAKHHTRKAVVDACIGYVSTPLWREPSWTIGVITPNYLRDKGLEPSNAGLIHAQTSAEKAQPSGILGGQVRASGDRAENETQECAPS